MAGNVLVAGGFFWVTQKSQNDVLIWFSYANVAALALLVGSCPHGWTNNNPRYLDELLGLELVTTMLVHLVIGFAAIVICLLGIAEVVQALGTIRT